jgi:hypothetical protein
MNFTRLNGFHDNNDGREFGIDPLHHGDLDEPCQTCSTLIEFRRRIAAMERLISSISHSAIALRRELNGLNEEFGELLDEYGHDAELALRMDAEGMEDPHGEEE